MAKSREFQQNLVATSAKPDPLQCQNGHITVREYLRTTHEEADVIIPMQLESAISEGRRNIAINCEDTDCADFDCADLSPVSEAQISENRKIIWEKKL